MTKPDEQGLLIRRSSDLLWIGAIGPRVLRDTGLFDLGTMWHRENSRFIDSLKRLEEPWCRRMLEKIVLPETVHDQSTYRIWQRRF